MGWGELAHMILITGASVLIIRLLNGFNHMYGNANGFQGANVL